ncbi:N-acetylmuramoyl-L-alanine amidase [mine drainage metagenome]|uniref:N-acetylmuramoyl-L-alanine amidase n=1 Tax=mine drainage metagenome TaxID=410659 RepID=A0A1J5S913_9ZZZZ
MKQIIAFITILCLFIHQSFGDDGIDKKKKVIIVWQPSHQTDTGKDFSEAETCNAIVEAAMKMKPHFKEYKVWSIGNENVHHSNVGSNTKIEHTSAIIDGKISGYAYELQEANKKHPQVFIAVHNNGGTKRNAVWGYIHYGDSYESENRILAARLIKAISSVTNLENRGVLVDSTTGRNDYRCQSTNKLSFYSLDENINTAPYRVLLEIGDNTVSRELLTSDEGRKKIGEALKQELAAWIAEKKLE